MKNLSIYMKEESFRNSRSKKASKTEEINEESLHFIKLYRSPWMEIVIRNSLYYRKIYHGI